MRNPFCSVLWAECTISQCEGLVMHSFEGSFGCLTNESLAPDLGIGAYRNNNQPFFSAFCFMKVHHSLQLLYDILACTL